MEVQCHGGPATVKILLDTLIAFPGVRLADAGEFTKRAFQVCRNAGPHTYAEFFNNVSNGPEGCSSAAPMGSVHMPSHVYI